MKNAKPFIAGRAINLLVGALAGFTLVLTGWGDPAGGASRPDLIVADFEGVNFGDWKVTGDAFGAGPAHGALPRQMAVDGFWENGFASSYHHGDGSIGRLTSPAFTVERKYIQFLIGGGGFAGKTCLNLLSGGKVVRTATGPNTEPGGSEHLDWQSWEVGALAGQSVSLEIVDDATGGWGHISVDQIFQTDRKLTGMIEHEVGLPLKVEKHYLSLPVKNGAAKRTLRLLVDGKTAREFQIELADARPDWCAYLDVAEFAGQSVVLQADELPENSLGLKQVEQSDTLGDPQSIYRQALRPQFHFTSRCGWLNDPNGLVFYQGEYHLFYQHNPYGWNWGNMSWGHAVSPDLVHWQELPVALYPDEHGTMFSGSAVVDWSNTAGFQTGQEPALVAMFTAAGRPFTQCLAHSNDRGRTWTKYTNNPVLSHLAAENRDPKVVWFAPEKKWVMALYLDHNDYALFNSPDLKHWEKLQDFTLPGDSECPNFFEVALDGDPHNPRWVFYGANGVYVVGKFDGRKFTPETQPRRLQNGNCWYASQVYSDLPAASGRCVLIPWGRLPSDDIFRGMPFNQMMGLPVELTLRSSASGPVLDVNPARELASLRQQSHDVEPQPLTADGNPLAGIQGDLFEIEAELTVGTAQEITFDLRGLPVTYHAASQTLSCLGNQATLKPTDGKISLRLFVDRRSVDIFGGQGRLYLPMASALAPDNHSLKLSCQGGTASIAALKIFELKSAWE